MDQSVTFRKRVYKITDVGTCKVELPGNACIFSQPVAS